MIYSYSVLSGKAVEKVQLKEGEKVLAFVTGVSQNLPITMLSLIEQLCYYVRPGQA